MTCQHTWTDLTQGLGPERHYYCKKCREHNYRGKRWSSEEWEAWINDEKAQLDLFAEAQA